MKKSLTFAFLFFVSYCGLYSQYFQKEQISIGPSIGVLEHGAFYGLSGEYGITKNIGIGLDLGFYQFKEDYSTEAIPNYQYDQIPPNEIKLNYKAYNFYLTGSYHFFPESRFDPFVRVGLGYINYGFDLSMGDNNSQYLKIASGFPSVFSTKIEAGINYHINDVLSFKTTVGYPYYFNSGFNINFNRPEPSPADLVKRSEKNVDDKYSLYFGYYLGANMSMPLSSSNERQFRPSFNIPDAGFSLYVPFWKNSFVGLLLNAGYSETSFTTKPLLNDNDTNTIKETYSFINIQPTLNLGGFLLGVKIGIPHSAQAKNLADQNQAIIANNYDEKTNRISSYSTTRKELINTQFDVLLGGSFTLGDFDSGKLKLNLQASYALVPLYKEYKDYFIGYDKQVVDQVTTYKPNKDNNPTPIAISLGLSYLFKIGF